MGAMKVVLLSVALLSIRVVMGQDDENISPEETTVANSIATDETAATDIVNDMPMINLTVFYNAIDNTTRDFLVSTIIPLFDTMQDYVTFELIPVAKSAYYNGVDSEWEFACDDDGAGCEDTLYHSCVLHSNATYENKLEFVKCYMEGETVANDDECASSNDIPTTYVETCANSEEGAAYLADSTQEALNVAVAMELSPTILINGEPVELTDVLQEICQINSLPESCSDVVYEN